MYYTDSIQKQNYLAEKGIKPIMETGKTAYYRKSKQLSSLLDSYYIRYVLIKNKI